MNDLGLEVPMGDLGLNERGWPAYVIKTCEHTGSRVIGSAAQFFRLTGNKTMEEACVPWPPDGSKERREMYEFAIAMATLMGMQAEQVDSRMYPQEEARIRDGKWCVATMKLALGFHASQGELACAYINHKGYWIVSNKGTWECVRI